LRQLPGIPAAMAVSHISLGSTTPLPHVVEQSISADASHDAGQQPSPVMHIVMTALAQIAVQVPARSNESVVHATLSSQDVGHAPGLPAAMAVSQVSCASTTPLPHESDPPPAPALPLLLLVVLLPPAPFDEPSLHADMRTKTPVNAPAQYKRTFEFFLVTIMTSSSAALNPLLARVCFSERWSTA
jgi:hypothetical protein